MTEELDPKNPPPGLYIRMPAEMYEGIRKLAGYDIYSKAEIVRRAIAAYLSRHL